VDQLTGTLSACDLIVTNKFHVGIVGVGLGRAVVSLPCHTKTVRFYRQIGGHTLCLAASDWTPEALEAILHDGWNRLRDGATLPEALLQASRANRDYVRSFVSACAGGERVS
jgi:polysaccharide pyruvyl transferase WcaK-like protein